MNEIISMQMIIEGSANGCRKMQNRLYREFAPKMYSVCIRYAKNASDAEDIMQEGFIKIFKNLHKFRGDGSFEGWIRTIITRTALGHISDKAKKQGAFTNELSPALVDNETGILDKLAEKDLVGIVKKLTPGYRKVFMMYVMEGFNHKEIAEILQCSEGNSKSQFFRSRIQLQKMLRKTA